MSKQDTESFEQVKQKQERIQKGKIPDLDCVSIGPDNFDIHTTNEHLSISSTVRVYEYLLEVLKSI